MMKKRALCLPALLAALALTACSLPGAQDGYHEGRMGDTTSEVYLASPAVAAASAVAGHICAPSDL